MPRQVGADIPGLRLLLATKEAISIANAKGFCGEPNDPTWYLCQLHTHNERFYSSITGIPNMGYAFSL